MNEILPGIYHWTAAHPKIKVEVSSYYPGRMRPIDCLSRTGIVTGNSKHPFDVAAAARTTTGVREW